MALAVIYAAKVLQTIRWACGFGSDIHVVRVADIAIAENENAARVQDPPSTPYKFLIALSAFGIIVPGVMVCLIIANGLIDKSHLGLRVLGTQFSNVTINIENDKVSLGGIIGLLIKFNKKGSLRLCPGLGNYNLSMGTAGGQTVSALFSERFDISTNYEQLIIMKFEASQMHLGDEDLGTFKKLLQHGEIPISLQGNLDVHLKASRVLIFAYTYKHVTFSCISLYKQVPLPLYEIHPAECDVKGF